MRSHAIRVQLEQSLQGGSPFPLCSAAPEDPPETISTGIRALDRLTGGLPRGRITEILGPASSGRTSLMLSALAQITARDEVCGVIDPWGAFDPASAAQLGADLRRLLWIRTNRQIDPTLKATDLLLQGGGFGCIGVDLGEFPAATLGRIPLSTWFRLQRAVEHTPTILMLIGHSSVAKNAASLALRLKLDATTWSPRLLHGLHPSAEIVRSKIGPKKYEGSREGFKLQLTENSHACFRTT